MVPVYLRATLADLLGTGSPADLQRWASEAEQYRGPREHHPGLTQPQRQDILLVCNTSVENTEKQSV